MGIEDVAPRMLKLGARQSFILRPLYTLGKKQPPVPSPRRHSTDLHETGTRVDTKTVWTLNRRDKSLNLPGKQTSIPWSSLLLCMIDNSLMKKSRGKIRPLQSLTCLAHKHTFKHTFAVLFNCPQSAQYSIIYRRHTRQAGIEPVSRTCNCCFFLSQ